MTAGSGMLDVRTWSDHGCTVVELDGELDVYSVQRLRESLLKLDNGGAARIAFDMTALDFLDSSGLGAIVGAMKRARVHDGGVCLIGAQERVLKIFRITGLSRVNPAFANLDEAFVWLDSQP
jgi:anti-sigma B factor antagonist